jgi:hypothetical protein
LRGLDDAGLRREMCVRRTRLHSLGDGTTLCFQKLCCKKKVSDSPRVQCRARKLPKNPSHFLLLTSPLAREWSSRRNKRQKPSWISPHSARRLSSRCAGKRRGTRHKQSTQKQGDSFYYVCRKKQRRPAAPFHHRRRTDPLVNPHPLITPNNRRIDGADVAAKRRKTAPATKGGQESKEEEEVDVSLERYEYAAPSAILSGEGVSGFVITCAFNRGGGCTS